MTGAERYACWFYASFYEQSNKTPLSNFKVIIVSMEPSLSPPYWYVLFHLSNNFFYTSLFERRLPSFSSDVWVWYQNWYRALTTTSVLFACRFTKFDYIMRLCWCWVKKTRLAISIRIASRITSKYELDYFITWLKRHDEWRIAALLLLYSILIFDAICHQHSNITIYLQVVYIFLQKRL